MKGTFELNTAGALDGGFSQETAIMIDACSMISLLCMSKIFCKEHRMALMDGIRDRLKLQNLDEDSINTTIASLSEAMDKLEQVTKLTWGQEPKIDSEKEVGA